MSIKQQIQSDFITAFKAKDQLKSSVLKMLQSEIKNIEIAQKGKGGVGDLNDDEVIQVVSKEVRKRKETAEIFSKEGRADTAEKELSEAEILSVYLPEQMSDEELRKLVKEAIEKTGATSIKDMGKVMGVLTPQISGKADAGAVSGIVKEMLA